jgi:teichuronic acid exporter
MVVSAQQTAAPEAVGKLDHSMVQALAWTGAAQWTVQIFSWVATIYVARLLSPTDYGVFAMAMVYMGFISLISEFGVGSAVIILRDLGSRQLAELNTISFGTGFLWMVISWAIAKSMGTFFSSNELPLVIIVMSIGFVISAPKIIPESLLQQELQFKLLACLDAVRAFGQSAATMAAALWGWGYWSFVIGYLFGTAFGTALTLAFRRHKFSWPRLQSLKPALVLSWDLVVTRIGWYLYTNADLLVAGRMLGEAPLGAYRLASSISNIPADKITGMVRRTSQAFFSAVQGQNELVRRYLLGLTRGLALVAIPASVGISLVSDEFVAVVLGSKWQEAVLPLRFLAFYVAVRTVAPLIPTVLNITGNSGFLARNSVVMSIVMPFGFFVGARWGVTGIAAAWVVMYPICLAPLYRRAFCQINLTFRQYFSALRAAIEGTLALIVVVLAVKYSIPSGVLLLTRLSLEIMAGVIAYVGFLMMFHRSSVQVFWQLLSVLRSSGQPNVTETARI